MDVLHRPLHSLPLVPKAVLPCRVALRLQVIRSQEAEGIESVGRKHDDAFAGSLPEQE